MGKYDNFYNEEAIAQAEKELSKLRRKRKADPYQISLAEEKLKNALLFQKCQAFTAFSNDAPNGRILFNDDKKLMLFIDIVIPYNKIKSYRILEKTSIRQESDTSAWDILACAHAGHKLAGDFGAITFAQARANSAQTISTEVADGFLFQVFLKNGQGYQCNVPNHGAVFNKIHPKWLELGKKIQRIIDGTDD